MGDTAKTEGAAKRGGSVIHISARAFISTVSILLVLMVGSGILTYIVPAGAYQHVVVDGVDRVVPGTFAFVGPETFFRADQGGRHVA